MVKSSSPLPQLIPVSGANEISGAQPQELTKSILKELSANKEHCSSNNVSFETPTSEHNFIEKDEVCDQRQLHKPEQSQCDGTLWQWTTVNLSQDQKLTKLQEEPTENISVPHCNVNCIETEEKIERYIAMSSISSPVSVNNFDLSQNLGTTLNSTVSHLIDAISLPSESEIGSPISALIAQFDATPDRTNLTMVSNFQETNKHTLSMMSGLSQPRGLEINAPVNLLCGDIKAKKACLNLTEDTIFSSPEMSDHFSYTIINEEILSPISVKYTPNRNISGTTFDGAFHKTLHLDTITPTGEVSTHDETWIDANDKCGSTNTLCITTENAILNASPPIDSIGSSLLDVDDLDFTITTPESCNEELSPAANFYQMSQKKSKKATNLLVLENSPVKNANERALCISERNIWNSLHSGANEASLAIHPFIGAKQQGASKSKSLGDLTSEDISCTFESKYKFISKGFVVPNIRGQKATPSLKHMPKAADALTEQLRRLVSLEQEENQESRAPMMRLESGYQRGLVRKLSSRSQSRVRYVANRAKQIQEANKHKLSGNSTSGDVVFRKKPPIQHHTVNRHSTGSYISGYLNQLKEEGLEGRGIPEGSCSTLLHRYTDDFYTDDSLFQTEPSTVSEPEIYFLLRL